MKTRDIITGFFLVVFFPLCFRENLYGQDTLTNTLPSDTARICMVTLKNGAVFYGKLVRQSADTVYFQPDYLEIMKIPSQQVKKLEIFDRSRIKKGKYWFPNPLPSRYFFSPSAYQLKQWEGYYQNNYLVLNSVYIGLTDFFSMGAGIELFTTLGSITQGEFMPTFFLTPKFGFKVTKDVHLGFGVLYSFIGADDNASTGIGYGLLTLGPADYNLTSGIGWGFYNTEFQKKPFVTVSGMARTGRKTAIVTENWIIPGDKYYPLFSYGIRFFSETLSVDLAFINSTDIAQAIFIGVPYVDFVVKF